MKFNEAKQCSGAHRQKPPRVVRRLGQVSAFCAEIGVTYDSRLSS